MSHTYFNLEIKVLHYFYVPLVEIKVLNHLSINGISILRYTTVNKISSFFEKVLSTSLKSLFFCKNKFEKDLDSNDGNDTIKDDDNRMFFLN